MKAIYFVGLVSVDAVDSGQGKLKDTAKREIYFKQNEKIKF